MKDPIKRYAVKAAAVLMLCAVLVFLPGCSSRRETETSKYVEDYYAYVAAVKYADTFMPGADFLGKTESLRCGYEKRTYSRLVDFVSYSVTLSVSYDAENYEKEKAAALARYDFLSEPCLTASGDYVFPVTEFSCDGYRFAIVPNTHYFEGEYTCKSFMMVGYNDAKRQMAYLGFYDFDLDILADKNADEGQREKVMRDLIKDAFAWF